MVEIRGRFNLDKQLSDGRRSPKALLPPEEEDVLILDQHTDKDNRVQYTKTVGVLRKSENENGTFNFDWTVTDPGLKELVRNAKHPEKLFKYSPEFKAINATEKHDQGEYGQLKHIAITNLANDDDAITTKIYNVMKNMADMVMKNAGSVTLNSKCAAAGLINAGKINRTSGWSFSTEDRKREPMSSFLGIDTSQPQDSPQRKKYPVIKNGQVYLSGLRAAASRGGQNAPAIGAKASALYEKAKAKGDKMEKNEIQETVVESVKPLVDRIEELEKLQEALKDIDFDKMQKTLESLEGLKVKVDDMEKNEMEAKEKLIKNIKTNGGLPEEDLVKMSLETLKELEKKYHKDAKGAAEGGKEKEKTIVDEINEEYGLDIGKNLKGDS